MQISPSHIWYHVVQPSCLHKFWTTIPVILKWPGHELTMLCSKSSGRFLLGNSLFSIPSPKSSLHSLATEYIHSVLGTFWILLTPNIFLYFFSPNVLPAFPGFSSYAWMVCHFGLGEFSGSQHKCQINQFLGDIWNDLTYLASSYEGRSRTWIEKIF